jgi:ferrous iron transport protein A
VLKLSELEPGRGGRVRKVSARGRFARRMLDMGIVCGSPVRVIKVAPLGDPMEVELKGYRLSLRRSEADMVLVEVPEGEHGHP